MLPATDEEKAQITQYYLGQSEKQAPDSKVTFLQKVYSEVIMGHRHDVWDVHATDGRWWVITNPTNLYSQEQFPNMDIAVTFHMGLCLRIPRTEQQRESGRHVKPLQPVLERLTDLSDAIGQAQNVSHYQAIGVRCREALLAFVGAAQDIADWPIDPAPKRADFRAWSDVICNTALAGASQKDRRHLFKILLNEAWGFSNWLTHAQAATWHDAEAAQTTVEHILGLSMSLLLRYVRDVPEQCPQCSSPRLERQEGVRKDAPEVLWERPVCENCGWEGTPVIVGHLEDDEIFVREGDRDDGDFVVSKVPLAKINKPGD